MFSGYWCIFCIHVWAKMSLEKIKGENLHLWHSATGVSSTVSPSHMFWVCICCDCVHAHTYTWAVSVGGWVWLSSGDWIIYRIFAQWLARGQTTGALGPVGVDLSLGSSGSLTVTQCVGKNNITEKNKMLKKKKKKDRKKCLWVHACVHKGRERGEQSFEICKHM